MSIPTVIINPNEELQIVLRLIYYNIPGFHPNSKKLQKACRVEGYDHFRLKDIAKWLENQYNYQIYLTPQKCKAEASFQKIKIPSKVHQCDILIHVRDNQDGIRIFVCSLLVIDVTTCFKAGHSLTSRNSLEVWNTIKEIYEDPANPLT